MSPHRAGVFLIAAALLFFAAWALMPAVGITDRRQIFEKVAARATSVRASVILQLVQGPNLVLLGPLLAAFFLGSIALSVGSARAGLLPRFAPWLHAAAVIALAVHGLALLLLVSASQAWLGVALLRREVRP